MAEILIGPTGSLIKGHVLDVNQKHFNEALQFYDKQLYTKWSPKKCGGWGAWEIRRRPDFNSALDIAEFEGNLIFVVGPKEYDMVHQIMDCAFLNYDQLRKLKEIDTWQYGNSSQYQDEVERRTRARQEKEQEIARKERTYMTQHYRAEIKAFRQMVLDGTNPAAIAQYWDRVNAAD